MLDARHRRRRGRDAGRDRPPARACRRALPGPRARCAQPGSGSPAAAGAGSSATRSAPARWRRPCWPCSRCRHSASRPARRRSSSFRRTRPRARTSRRSRESWVRAGRRPSRVVASSTKPITDKALLRELNRFQASLAKDPRVASVVGPGELQATARSARSCRSSSTAQRRCSRPHLPGLKTLEEGLGTAGSGLEQLQAGIAAWRRERSRLPRLGSGQASVRFRASSTPGSRALRPARPRSRAASAFRGRGSEEAPGRRRAAAGGTRATALGGGKEDRGRPRRGRLEGGRPGCRWSRPMARDVASSATSVRKRCGLRSRPLPRRSAPRCRSSRRCTLGTDDPAYQAAIAALGTGERPVRAATTSSINAAASKLGLSGQHLRCLRPAGRRRNSTGLEQLLSSGSQALSSGIAQLNAGAGQLAVRPRRPRHRHSNSSTPAAGRSNAGLQKLTSGARRPGEQPEQALQRQRPGWRPGSVRPRARSTR